MSSFGFTARGMRARLLLALALVTSLASVSAGTAHAAAPVDLGDPGGEGLSLAGLSENGQVAGHIAFPADGVRRAFSGNAATGMINLAPFGGSGPKAGASASAISRTGVVVGDSSLQRSATPGDVVNHAFSWTPSGGMVDLGSLGGDLAGAAGVSGNGKIVVGVSTIPGEAVVPAFAWTQAGGMVQLPGLPGATCPKWCSVARIVNDAGVIAGTTYGTDNQVHGVVWLPSGDIVDLGVFGTQSSPAAINASGQVVGSRIVGGVTRAFSWTLAGGIVDIAPPAAGSTSYAADVNDAGQVVGAVNDHPFVWTQAGGLVVLGNLGAGSGTGGASDVNASGVVVGTSTALDLKRHPYLWTPSTGMIDLGLPSSGWVQPTLFISDSGWIAGTGTLTTSPVGVQSTSRLHVVGCGLPAGTGSRAGARSRARPGRAHARDQRRGRPGRAGVRAPARRRPLPSPAGHRSSGYDRRRHEGQRREPRQGARPGLRSRGRPPSPGARRRVRHPPAASVGCERSALRSAPTPRLLGRTSRARRSAVPRRAASARASPRRRKRELPFSGRSCELSGERSSLWPHRCARPPSR